MITDEGLLPPKILLEDFSGNYKTYIDAVYSIFESDFIRHKALFGHNKLALKFHPLFQERAYTFYHMTHKGDDEQNRLPDLRRCECMPWARPVIEKTSEFNLRFWEQERNGKHRVCIWLETESDNYFVILDVRKRYVLLWTAFYAEHRNQICKREMEYNRWLESVGNKQYTPDMLIDEIQAAL